MRALPFVLPVLLCAACAAPPGPIDGWSIERRAGAAPSLISTSVINGATPAASAPLASVPIRRLARERWQVALAADSSLATEWRAGAGLFDAELARALDWLAHLGRHESRGLELRVTLVDQHGARRHVARHPAAEVLVVDLLVPVPRAPRSRSAVLEAALATGLHEAAHALRPHGPDGEREADELRASLVAACYRIEGMQRTDRLRLPAAATVAAGDFTHTHSARAAHAANELLRQALGRDVLDGADHQGRARLQAQCRQRLGWGG